MSATASRQSSSPKRSVKRTTAIPSRLNASRTCSAVVAAAVISVEEGGGGVKDRVQVYHLRAELCADGELPGRQPVAPVRSLRVVPRAEPAEHRFGRLGG